MRLSLTLLETNTQIAKLITEEIKNILETAINKAMPNIIQEVKDVVAEALRNQPEYSSLMAGTLRAEFGIPNPSSVNNVIELLVETLKIKKNNITANTKGIRGGFILTMMKSNDLGGVIKTEDASVQDSQGYSLPWLEWLLLRGNDTIVKNYEVSYVNAPYSRSGMAIMIPSSDSWRVPPEFAGTEENNWTIRAINSVEDNIYKIIQNNIEKQI